MVNGGKSLNEVARNEESDQLDAALQVREGPRKKMKSDFLFYTYLLKK